MIGCCAIVAMRSGQLLGTEMTKNEKWLASAETCVASATAVSSAVNAVVPSGAVKMRTSFTVLPGGSSVGSIGSVTVTGVVNCCPSGPNATGVPTDVFPAGMGADGSAEAVMVVPAGAAPG